MAALAVSLKLTVLSCHQCLLHNRHLDVEVLLGEVEVGLEGLRDATVLGFRKRERPRFVLPGNTVKVQQASTFALCVVREALSLHAPGWLGPHPTESSSGRGCRHGRPDIRPRSMARLRLTPQKREFFDLYTRASANTVEI